MLPAVLLNEQQTGLPVTIFSSFEFIKLKINFIIQTLTSVKSISSFNKRTINEYIDLRIPIGVFIIIQLGCEDHMSSDSRRRKESEIIEELFSYRKIDQLQQYLDEHDLDLTNLIDSQGNTVLHQLAYEGHIDIIRLLVKRAKRYLSEKRRNNQLYERDQQQQISAWMNVQNNQGFTPLLYASYNGHIDIIKYLVQQYQVNVNLTARSGLNPLHLASQKNTVLSIIYFRGKLDINEPDLSGSTPLHWASYMGSQEVLLYLLSCEDQASLNAKDKQGNTPLMMAVTYGNTRIARKLLLKGADRYLKNKSNQTPLDVARSNSYNTIAKMLNEEFSCVDHIRLYCNIKIQYKPKKRSMCFPLIFIIAFLVNFAILNVLISYTSIYSLLFQCLVFGATFIIFLSLLKGPRQIQQKVNLQDLLRGNQKAIKDFCFSCRINTPKRGYHCQICGVCVQQYDHHCTWINNCVGKRNIARFIFFLFFLILSFGLLGLVSFLGGVSLIIDQPQIYKVWFVFRYPELQVYEHILTIFLLAINFISSLFALPVIALFLVQIKNLLKNKTTYETYRTPQEQPNQMKERLRKYDSRVSFRNCRMMCIDNLTQTNSKTPSRDQSSKT